MLGPNVLSVTPQFGPLAGGTAVTIIFQRLAYRASTAFVTLISKRRRKRAIMVATIREILVGNNVANVTAVDRFDFDRPTVLLVKIVFYVFTHQ